MDTPERTKVGPTPLRNFEDSPVFNFISNLSPIQPVKSTESLHIQSFNYASLTSIFTSPHDNLEKDSKILTRSSFTDSSRQLSSSENVDEYSSHTGVAGVQLSASVITENKNLCSVNEASTDPFVKYPANPSSSCQSMQFDGGSPNHNTTPCFGIKMNVRSTVEHTPVELIHTVDNALESRKKLLSFETSHGHSQVQGKDVITCEWDELIADGEESLLFSDSHAESGPCTRGGEEARETDNLQRLTISSNDDKAIQDSLNSNSDIRSEDAAYDASNGIWSTNQNQVDNQQPWRRCLVFEMTSTAKGNLYSDSNPDSSRCIPFKENVSDSNCLKPAITPLACALPGIGLHLNTLASTSKERMLSKENMTSGKKIICTMNSTSSFPSTTGNNNMGKFKTLDTVRNDAQDASIIHDDVMCDIVGNSEELSQDSPKKKRRRLENEGEGDGCKHCNCKKSKCLKLYCECFAAGVYCSEPCSCQGCFNKPIHEEMVLSTRKQIESRNPLAFAPKVIRSSESGQETSEKDIRTPASARHKRGCSCKKSSCLKKYCECFQGGIGCSISCRCEGCRNAFGKKEGTLSIVADEVEQSEEHNNSYERETNELGEGQHDIDAHSDDRPPHKELISITAPFKSCSFSVDLPFMSSGKPPRSSKFSIGTSGLFGCRMLCKEKLEKNVDAILEDVNTPDTQRLAASPTKAVRIASPNSKRVSPPHNVIGLTSIGKGGRKLILKSIPSLPSLDNDVSTENVVGYPGISMTSFPLS